MLRLSGNYDVNRESCKLRGNPPCWHCTMLCGAHEWRGMWISNTCTPTIAHILIYVPVSISRAQAAIICVCICKFWQNTNCQIPANHMWISVDELEWQVIICSIENIRPIVYTDAASFLRWMYTCETLMPSIYCVWTHPHWKYLWLECTCFLMIIT